MAVVIQAQAPSDANFGAHWDRKKRKRISSTDAPIICGVSPFDTPLSLWHRKLTGYKRDETEFMYWGTAIERLIAARYKADSGRAVTNPGRYTMHYHPEHPWMSANVDRIIEDNGDGDGPGILECKTASAWIRAEWEDGPPLHYTVQVQHQLAVLGYSWAVIAVLLGGNEYREYPVARNDTFIAALIEKERAFLELLNAKTPPPADDSIRTAYMLMELHPDDSGLEVTLSDKAVEWVTRMEHLKEKQGEVEDEIDRLQTRIKAVIGPNTFAVGPGIRYSWKTQERKGQVRVDPIHAPTLCGMGIPYDETAPSKTRVLRKLKVKA